MIINKFNINFVMYKRSSYKIIKSDNTFILVLNGEKLISTESLKIQMIKINNKIKLASLFFQRQQLL